MQVMCTCGKTLDPEGKCDASHALTKEQYEQMIKRRYEIAERRLQIDLAEYRKRNADL
jgi:hypothetical protein